MAGETPCVKKMIYCGKNPLSRVYINHYEKIKTKFINSVQESSQWIVSTAVPE